VDSIYREGTVVSVEDTPREDSKLTNLQLAIVGYSWKMISTMIFFDDSSVSPSATLYKVSFPLTGSTFGSEISGSKLGSISIKFPLPICLIAKAGIMKRSKVSSLTAFIISFKVTLDWAMIIN
jgi:hypothetical protein